MNKPGLSIVVAGSRRFPSNEWPQAIIYYLNEWWNSKREFIDNPTIKFGHTTLRLLFRPEHHEPTYYRKVIFTNRGSGLEEIGFSPCSIRYTAYTSQKENSLRANSWSDGCWSEARRIPDFPLGSQITLRKGDVGALFHDALMRFVKDGNIKLIDMQFLYRGQSWLKLWKTEDGYDFSGYGLELDENFNLYSESTGKWF